MYTCLGVALNIELLFHKLISCQVSAVVTRLLKYKKTCLANLWGCIVCKKAFCALQVVHVGVRSLRQYAICKRTMLASNTNRACAKA